MFPVIAWSFCSFKTSFDKLHCFEYVTDNSDFFVNYSRLGFIGDYNQTRQAENTKHSLHENILGVLPGLHKVLPNHNIVS